MALLLCTSVYNLFTSDGFINVELNAINMIVLCISYALFFIETENIEEFGNIREKVIRFYCADTILSSVKIINYIGWMKCDGLCITISLFLTISEFMFLAFMFMVLCKKCLLTTKFDVIIDIFK